MSKITKEEFESLLSKDISQEQYSKIIAKIDIRVDEICKKFFKKMKQKKAMKWWYDNGSWQRENYSEATSLAVCRYSEVYVEGHFSPERYDNYIYIEGSNIKPPPGHEYFFPTSWLWEDFGSILDAEAKIYSDSKKQVKCLKDSIREKLTGEELKFVSLRTNVDFTDKGKKLQSFKDSMRKKLTMEEFMVLRFKD